MQTLTWTTVRDYNADNPQLPLQPATIKTRVLEKMISKASANSEFDVLALPDPHGSDAGAIFAVDPRGPVHLIADGVDRRAAEQALQTARPDHLHEAIEQLQNLQRVPAACTHGGVPTSAL